MSWRRADRGIVPCRGDPRQADRGIVPSGGDPIVMGTLNKLIGQIVPTPD